MKRSLVQFIILCAILSLIKLKIITEITTHHSTRVNSAAFAGSWDWKTKGHSLDFGIEIKQAGDSLKGQLCGTTLNGSRTDCATDDDQSFSIPLTVQNNFTCTFTSAYSAARGTASLTLDGPNLIWKIIKEPAGAYYFPPMARLTRVKTQHH